jgi:hypothetical protein
LNSLIHTWLTKSAADSDAKQAVRI